MWSLGQKVVVVITVIIRDPAEVVSDRSPLLPE